MKKYILIIAVCLIVICGLAYYFVTRDKGEDETVLDYIARAEEYLEDKQYSNALEQYKLAINTDPSNTEAYIEASEIYILKSKYDEAFQLLQNGETSAQNPDKIHHKIGEILTEQEDLEGALTYFEQANVKNPSNWENAIDLVKNYAFYQDKKDAAIKILNDINIGEGEGYVYKYYYLALLSYDNIGSALTYLDKANSQASGDIKDSIDHYLEVARKVQADPEDLVQNNTLLAYELMRSELYPTAISPLETVISENDEYYAAFMYLGICHKHMNNLDKARENLEKATTIEPNELQPHIFLAQVYTLQNNQQLAIETYEAVLNLEKDSEEVRYDLAQTLVNFELYRQAGLEYQELLDLNTQNIIKYKVELAYLKLDHLDEFEEALTIAKEVVEDWETFQSIESTLQARALDVLGWAYEKNGQKDEAQKYLNRALEGDPYLASAYYHLGVIYAEIESFSEAQLNLERAIDLDLEGEISTKASSELEKLSESKVQGD